MAGRQRKDLCISFTHELTSDTVDDLALPLLLITSSILSKRIARLGEKSK